MNIDIAAVVARRGFPWPSGEVGLPSQHHASSFGNVRPIVVDIWPYLTLFINSLEI